MSDKLFFDTNILIYAVASDGDRSPVALRWLSQGGCISVQVLNEFTNVARRKLNRPWDDIVIVLDDLRAACSECVSITEQTHQAAVVLARRHRMNIYDASMIASAIGANCTTLVSEDMQHGQRIGMLTIHDPFRHDGP